MKEMTRKEFLKLTGASTALLAMSHIIPTSAYADTSKIDAPSAGMYISEVVDLSGLSPVEQEKILTERNIPYDSTITYEKIVVERPAARDSYKGVPYRFQITYGNKPVKNERRSVVSPAAAAVLDRGVNILIGLTKPYIWIPFTASGLTPSQIFIYSDPSQYASTNIYTHLKIRQCEFYKDYSWQPNAFLERATIEDTTVTYALVNPKTKRFTSQLQRRQNIEKLLTMTTIAISWKKPTIALSIIFRLIRKMLERRIKMKFQTKLTLCKAVFIFIAIVVCALWAFEFRIAAVVVLLIDYIFDFITRRCPFCGKHFSIVLTVKDRCPFCGKLFE